jgi:type I restriction-modification system DNA methylase subunit
MVQEKFVTEELTPQEIELLLWKAADILRGAVRPEGYGNYILPLPFFKRLSDVYLAEYQALLEKFGSDLDMKRLASLTGELMNFIIRYNP